MPSVLVVAMVRDAAVFLADMAFVFVFVGLVKDDDDDDDPLPAVLFALLPPPSIIANRIESKCDWRS